MSEKLIKNLYDLPAISRLMACQVGLWLHPLQAGFKIQQKIYHKSGGRALDDLGGSHLRWELFSPSV